MITMGVTPQYPDVSSAVNILIANGNPDGKSCLKIDLFSVRGGGKFRNGHAENILHQPGGAGRRFSRGWR